jgi:hypothetical protein
MKTLILKFIILGFVLFISCAKEATLTPTDEDQQLVQLAKNIEEFAKNKACTGGDNCRSMAMGSKACGGPTSYLIYSLTKTDEKLLSEKVKQYTDLEKEINIKYNRVSDCRFLMPPMVDCLNGVCASK